MRLKSRARFGRKSVPQAHRLRDMLFLGKLQKYWASEKLLRYESLSLATQQRNNLDVENGCDPSPCHRTHKMPRGLSNVPVRCSHGAGAKQTHEW